MGFSYDAGVDLRKLKVGYSKKWFEQVGFGPGSSVPASQAHHDALKALGELGVQLVEVELPAHAPLITPKLARLLLRVVQDAHAMGLECVGSPNDVDPMAEVSADAA